VHLKIKKGIDLPLSNSPKGEVKDFIKTEYIGLDLSIFSDLRLRFLLDEGDSIKIGQPIVEDKVTRNRVFISPAAGTIKEVVRGEKKRIKTIVIKVNAEENFFEINPLKYDSLKPSEIIKVLHENGLLAHVIARPFCRIPKPDKLPKSIFVKALESAPYVPDSKMQLKGFEKEFQCGLNVLEKIAPKKVHLVHKLDDNNFFSEVENVNKHTAIGPHPISNSSLHIYMIDPIINPNDLVWTLSINDVITFGMFFTKFKYHTERIIGIGGSGIKSEKTGFFKTRMGTSLKSLLDGRLIEEDSAIISGDPLTGCLNDIDGYLGFFHTSLCAIKKNIKREPFHFFRLGKNKYSATKTYLSGFFKSNKFEFTTNQHGESRAFVDSSVYEKTMPMRIPTMALMKAIISEDFESAVEFGLLEIAPEDFALPAFICPSKIEMVDIVKKGLKRYSEETGL
jgi:Na+-transporting NADH:ubiquinone oxidoreductase subunit A